MNYGELKFEEDDQLNRKDFVVNLMKVVSNWNKIKNESDSLVVSIYSPWGSGKSYFLNM
jgi:predicted AAA+ superfamily ATPase